MDLRYISKLGRGAFADVWRAEDSMGRHVAVKFFNDTQPNQAEQNALTHAKALARVHHPAVVRVISLERLPHPDSEADCLAIVMEFVDGPNLSLHRGPLSQDLGLAAVRDVTAAIEAIHDAGLVHGDLHDANVLITEKGAKVVDILYTHSLAEVGTKTAARTRQDDIRSLAIIGRQIAEKSGADPRRLEEAFFRASTATTPHLVRAAFEPVLLHDVPLIELEQPPTVGSALDADLEHRVAAAMAHSRRVAFDGAVRVGAFHGLPIGTPGILTLSLAPRLPPRAPIDLPEARRSFSAGPLCASGWHFEYAGRALVFVARFPAAREPWSVLELSEHCTLRAACGELLNPPELETVHGSSVAAPVRSLPSVAYERYLIAGTVKYLNGLRAIGAEGDLYLSFSLLNVRDTILSADRSAFRRPRRVYPGNDIVPDVLRVSDGFHADSHSVAQLMRPAFDHVWREYGFERSFNYDARGNWVGQ